MAKFKCVVARVGEYEIELDESLFNKEFIEDFNGGMIAQYNNGEELCDVNGVINKRLEWFLDWLYDENE